MTNLGEVRAQQKFQEHVNKLQFINEEGKLQDIVLPYSLEELKKVLKALEPRYGRVYREAYIQNFQQYAEGVQTASLFNVDPALKKQLSTQAVQWYKLAEELNGCRL